MEFIAARRLVLGFILSGLVVAVIGTIAFSDSPVQLTFCVLIVLALVAAAVVVLVKFCRCRNCGKVPINGLLKLEYCPRCKHSLITGKTKKQEKKDRK